MRVRTHENDDTGINELSSKVLEDIQGFKPGYIWFEVQVENHQIMVLFYSGKVFLVEIQASEFTSSDVWMSPMPR